MTKGFDIITGIKYSSSTINKPESATKQTKYDEVQKDINDLTVDIANTGYVLSSIHGGFRINCF